MSVRHAIASANARSIVASSVSVLRRFNWGCAFALGFCCVAWFPAFWYGVVGWFL
jgi:hypothetical protein